MFRRVTPLTLSLALVAASGGLVGCGHTYWKADRYNAEPKPNQTGYIIMPTDYLGIGVWKNNDLSVKVRVRPDGNITMPLVGEVQAGGLTIVELRDKIAKKLCQFIQCGEAPISVNLLQVSGYKFTVVGKVERPGTFAPKDYVTLLDALALAGGTTRFADGDGIVIIRKAKDGSQYEIPVSYDQLKTGKTLYMNIVLLGGDIVSVP